MGLAFRIQPVAARSLRGLAALRAPAVQREDMLIGERGGDGLDQLAWRRREPDEPGNAATLATAVAQHLGLHDVPALVSGAVPWKRVPGSSPWSRNRRESKLESSFCFCIDSKLGLAC